MLPLLFLSCSKLWMGTHPKAPSVAAAPPYYRGISLAELIEDNKKLLGEEVEEAFDGHLPFLFKVLSVNKSLSIQAHPTKEHAAKLHVHRPDLYPDPNHKPEMAIGKVWLLTVLSFYNSNL